MEKWRETLLSGVLILALCMSVWPGPASFPANGTDPRILYAQEKLTLALANAGYRVGSEVSLSILGDTSSKALPEVVRCPQGFRLSVSQRKIEITGFDAAGVLYGALDLVERIESAGHLPDTLSVVDAPVMKLRGVCILLMKLGTYNYPITPKTFPFFYDKKLWLEYLDFLAGNRFNYIAFWNGHPFDYFVKMDKYPEAQSGISPGLLQKNHDMLLWLCREGPGVTSASCLSFMGEKIS